MKIHFPVVNKNKTQLGESFSSPEVESDNLIQSNIGPFDILYGEMDEDSFHQKMEGNDLTYYPLFSDKEFLNEDRHNLGTILITHVQQVLERDYPDHELVVSQVHDYYNLPISTFACKDRTLVIHISFYIKPRNQEPLFLYDIRTIPVPYHMNEELIDESESKYTYTKVKPTTRILAMGSNTQINLDYDQLVHCVKYNILFFCEQMFLEK